MHPEMCITLMRWIDTVLLSWDNVMMTVCAIVGILAGIGIGTIVGMYWLWLFWEIIEE